MPTKSIRAHLKNLRQMAKDDRANISGIGGNALAVAGVIIGAVVGLLLISSLFPTYSSAVKNLSANMTSSDWGNTTANAIAPTFGMLIALGGLFAIVGVAFVAYNLAKK